MKIDCVPAGLSFHLVDANGAAALALGCEIARLPPFQGFLECSDALGGVSRVEDQPAQRQQFCLHRLRIGAEDGIYRRIWIACGFFHGAGRSAFPDRLFHHVPSAHSVA
jgi:hypothetical protein